jgi:hypothetical protein
MKWESKIMLLSIIVLMTGCKLAVIVVEGGDVQSTGAGICVASTICIVDVNDANFSETFTAVPDNGWRFQKWNSGDRFFCRGSTDPTCTLSFEGHEESEYVEEMVASSELFYLMPVFRESTDDTVVVDGKSWLQPALFRNLSWEDIQAVCPSPTEVCAGVLNGFDLTGWTWASSDSVESLFEYYKEAQKLLLDDFAYTVAEKDNDTGRVVNHTLYAILSNAPPTGEGGAAIATVYDGQPYVPSMEDLSIYPSPLHISEASDTVGVWFWMAL